MKNRRHKFPGMLLRAAIPAKSRNLDAAGEPVSTPEKRDIAPAARLLGKYGSTSIIATSADFTAFHLALTYALASPVWATVTGRSVGSLVAFLMHRSWVFRQAKHRDGNVLRLKYVVGILMGMGLNAAGVGFLNGVAGMDPWPARVMTATTVWLFGFVFNRKIVFGQ